MILKHFSTLLTSQGFYLLTDANEFHTMKNVTKMSLNRILEYNYIKPKQ